MSVDDPQKNVIVSAAAAFRSKVAQMKGWKPESTPSNRDRLELYALHKQAVTGDAPSTLPSSSASVADKAKYQSWRAKTGVNQSEAMSMYYQECDRQIRVYGTTPQTPKNTPNRSLARGGGATTENMTTLMPRGLAAIPLLCAAAAESRAAYQRRLANTSQETAWWGRQEPLCSPPGTIGSFPETFLIAVASVVETISLMCEDMVPILPSSLVRSFLWPIHNCFLSLWMAFIIVRTALGSACVMGQTLLWGARRTGLSLDQIWNEEIKQTVNAANSLCEAHQPMSTRLVGLALLPYGVVVGLTEMVLKFTGLMVASLAYSGLMFIFMWWYWLLVLPWMASCLLGTAGVSGFLLTLIDAARL